MLFGSGTAQTMHRRWFEMHLPETGVRYRNASDDWHGIALSGPNARALLARLCREDVSNESFRFRDIRRSFAGGVPALFRGSRFPVSWAMRFSWPRITSCG